MLFKKKIQNIESFRYEYTKGSLRRYNLPKDPLELFELWLKQACKAKIIDPTAMVISTVDKYGIPYQRIVLLKHYDDHGLVFYTNLKSRKAHHIQKNPNISLLFPWYMLERQVIITGKAKRLSKPEIAKYFYNRPFESQISAWTSKQSQKISNRNILEKKFLKLKRKFLRQNEIPVPNFWGGFRISAKKIEFWQGRKYRLHDRFLYQLDNNKWKIYRLSP